MTIALGNRWETRYNLEMMNLTMNFLGSFEVQRNNEPLRLFDSNKARALLAYLAVESGRPHQRAKLAALLWPDWSDSEALKNLRPTLAKTRKLLGDPDAEQPFLLVTHRSLQFNTNSSFTLDVMQFTHAIANRRQVKPSAADSIEEHSERIELLRNGIELYKGDFLEGFSLPACTEFEEWVLLTRERYRRMMLNACGRLASYHEESGEYGKAIEYANRQLALEPWLEESHRYLMRLLALDGQRSMAIAQFEKCCALLADELGIEPALETVELYQEILTERLNRADPSSTKTLSSPTPIDVAIAKATSATDFPRPLTPLIGREIECAQVQGMLTNEHIRLVTVTGSGGVGKTSLCQQVAHRLENDFRDGARFIPLASVQEAILVVDAIARVLDIHATGTQTVEERLLAVLASKQLLLLIDNFEHLLDASQFVTELLAACPSVKVFISSREALHLSGEYEFPLQTLPYPASPEKNAFDALRAYPSLQLFEQYAQRVKPDFALNLDNISDIAYICKRLDGLPLAIELAAARVKMFSPQALNQRLHEASSYTFRQLLKSNRQGSPERHRSLWHAISWSHQLLEEDERALFCRMSLFVGGCTLDAVQAVCVDEESETDALSGITSLVEKHLVYRIDQVDGDSRFMMLETVREFGLLNFHADEDDHNTQEKFAIYYANLAGELDSELKRENSAAALQYLDYELENLRAVMKNASTTRELEAALTICGILANYWSRRRQQIEGRRWCDIVLERVVDWQPTPSYARALFTRAFLSQSAHESRRYFERSLAMSRVVGPNSTISLSLALLGNTAWNQGQLEQAHKYFTEAAEFIHESDAEWHLAMIYTNQAGCYASEGRFAEARATLSHSREMHRRVGEKWAIGFAMIHEARLTYFEGEYAQALELSTKAFRYGETLEDNSHVGSAKLWIGLCQLQLGEYESAQTHFSDLLKIYIEMNNQREIANAFRAFAIVAEKKSQYERVLVINRAMTNLCKTIGYVVSPIAQNELDRSIQIAKRNLPNNSSDQIHQWVDSMSLQEIATYVLDGAL